MILAYQSDSQIRAAFKDKPSLLYDNTDVQIYLGASSYETAERLSKSIGDRTQVLEQYGETESWQPSGDPMQSGGQRSRSTSLTYSENGRALLRAEEILTLNKDYLIVLQRGTSPILAERVKWYQDPDFNPAVPRRTRQPWRWENLSWDWKLLVAGVVCLILLALANSVNH